MGEIIKKIGSIDIGPEQFQIELNKSPSNPQKHEIHIQNDSFRLALPEEDFCRMAAGIILARKQLHQIKGINE